MGEGDEGVKGTAQSSLETLILQCVVGEREEGDWEGKGWRAGAGEASGLLSQGCPMISPQRQRCQRPWDSSQEQVVIRCLAPSRLAPSS